MNPSTPDFSNEALGLRDFEVTVTFTVAATDAETAQQIVRDALADARSFDLVATS